MNEQENKQSFQEMLDESFAPLKSGNIVKGTIVSVSPTEVIVDLGYKSDGIVSRSEFTTDQNAELTDIAKPGDSIDVWVLRVNDGEGNVVCSKRKVDSQANIKNIEEAFNSGASMLGKVIDVVKGGLSVSFQGVRAFVPSSQASNRFIKDLTEFKGKEFMFNIIEFDRSKRLRIIAGRKDLAAAEAKARHDEVFGKVAVGAQIEGTVSRVVDFGAFVDLGGVDALLHVTEISWDRVKKVSDVLTVGQKVTAIVKDFDPEKGKISLSLKDPANDPWAIIPQKYPVGSIVQGTVVRFATFGAFVHLEDGIDGLIHISQIANKRVAKAADELTVGDTVNVKVTNIDMENRKISLSKRDADAMLNPEDGQYYADDEYYDDGDDMIEEDMVEEVETTEE